MDHCYASWITAPRNRAEEFQDKFPVAWHPHMGMDIMTYMREGYGRQADSLGNRETPSPWRSETKVKGKRRLASNGESLGARWCERHVMLALSTRFREVPGPRFPVD